MSKKKILKICLTGATAIAVFGTILNVAAENINVSYNNIKVTLNEQRLALKDANEDMVEPFSYNGTVYIPVRAISQSLGLTVGWDDATNTVLLTGTPEVGITSTEGMVPPTRGTGTGTRPDGTELPMRKFDEIPDGMEIPDGEMRQRPNGMEYHIGETREIPDGIEFPTEEFGERPNMTEHPNGGIQMPAGTVGDKDIDVEYMGIKVEINGKTAVLQDANGNDVEPFNYNGTVYLPVRAISQALGLTVDWDDAASAVKLTK